MKKQPKKHRLWLWLLIGIGLFIIISALMSDQAFLPDGPRIGLVEITEPIFSSRSIVKDLNYFDELSNVDAILIRLDTPGGAVAASQEIYEKVKKISQGSKPILVSMGNVAASGGYYVAIGADSIIANPGTATGSIGVIMGFPIASELMGKLGLGYETIKSGKLKDSGSTFREVNAEDRKYFQDLVNNLHEQFVSAVAVERAMTIAEIQKLATGQAYSGKQALDLGLIDRLGTFEDAIYLTGSLTNIDGKPILVKPPARKKGIIDEIVDYFTMHLKIGKSYPEPQFRIY